MHFHDNDHEHHASEHDGHEAHGTTNLGFVPLDHALGHFEPHHDALISGIVETIVDLASPYLPGLSHSVEPHVDGTPATDSHYWHHQDHNNTCAVVSQQSVIEELTGRHLTEDGLMQEAANHGWYTPGPNGGTPLYHTGDLLVAYGIHVHKRHGCSVRDLAHELDKGHKVIVGLNGEMVWNALEAGSNPLSEFVGIPGQRADHAVEVIGIDYTDPRHPEVILNDSGTHDGCGERVPIDLFEMSWATCNNFMVSTTGRIDGHKVPTDWFPTNRH